METNREIKFREFVNGKFHYWGFVGDGIFNGPATPSLTRGKHDQFTGLKDKNGKEIYEGDVMALKDSELPHKNRFEYIVKFEDAKFVLYHIKNDYGKWGDLYRAFDYDFKAYNFCVIGNIYENS